MKQTDEQIIATVRKILDILHNPNTGFFVFRDKLREQHLTKEEHRQRIIDKEYELAEKYGLTKSTPIDEVKFKLTGKDIMDSHLYVSCGQAAKAFCYVNKLLPKYERLPLRVLFSTDIAHLVDAKSGHVLPCVKLSDGKLHAIEPQIQPEQNKQPGFQFVCDDVKAGGEIWHQLEPIKERGRPYQITKIVTPEEHETTYSDFGKFLEACMIHKGKLRFICSTLRQILKNPRQHKNTKYQIYEICKALEGKKSTIKVLHFTGDERHIYKIVIEHNGVYYNINSAVQYLSLNQIDFNNPNVDFNHFGCKLQQIFTPEEYIQKFEKRTKILTHINNKGRE